MTAWVLRAGRFGERESWALENQVAGAGWHEISDMASADSREAVREMVKSAFPADSPAQIANATGQLWAVRNSIQPGDLIVMPMKTTKKIAIGVCTSGYDYRAHESDGDSRHTIGVDWQRSDISRANLLDDLRNTINGSLTVFQAAKNQAEARLRTVLDTGLDPGATSVDAGSPATSAAPADDGGASITDPTTAPTLEAIRDRVTTHLVENFSGHRLTDLIAAILRADGFVCDVSPPGPDQGVDIIAGRGPLGLDKPTLIVEVKSEAGPIGSTVVRGLQGAMRQHGADQGLLVAWGGLNRQARNEIRTDRLTVRVWEADDVLDRLFASYERLSSDLRSAIPLTRAWVLDEDPG